jgi:hypothetical protein
MKPRPRVLLLDLYLLEIDAVVRERRPFIQPYLYLGAFLERAGVPHDLYRWYGPEHELAEVLRQGSYAFVFINLLMGPVLERLEPAGRIVRQVLPRAQIWVGGPAVKFIPDLLSASPVVDRVSRGCPMRAPAAFFAELAACGLVDGHVPPPGPGLALAGYRQMEAFVHEHSSDRGSVRALGLTTACSCPNHCAFCYLRRTEMWCTPVPELLAEVARLQERHGIGYFEFCDDNFAADLPRLEAFAAAVAEAKLELAYFCLGSIDALSPQALDLLVGSGLRRIFVGVDAIHERGLRLFGKAYAGKDVVAAIDRLRRLPVDLTLAVVLGAFGETREEVEALYAWVASVAPEICAPQFLAPYPGTPMFAQAVARGFVPPDTLAGWARACDQRLPKPYFSPTISVEEYAEWDRKLEALGSKRFRSGIGDSARRLRRQPGDEARAAEIRDQARGSRQG